MTSFPNLDAWKAHFMRPGVIISVLAAAGGIIFYAGCFYVEYKGLITTVAELQEKVSIQNGRITEIERQMSEMTVQINHLEGDEARFQKRVNPEPGGTTINVKTIFSSKEGQN